MNHYGLNLNLSLDFGHYNMTFTGYLKQTKCMQVFKKWCEIKWKEFWCEHHYVVDKKSIMLPMKMPTIYYCEYCNKFKEG